MIDEAYRTTVEKHTDEIAELKIQIQKLQDEMTLLRERILRQELVGMPYGGRTE